MNNISFFKKYKPKNLNDLNYKSQLVGSKGIEKN